MKQYLFAMVAVMVLGLAASCGDTETVIEGTQKVAVQGPVVNYDVPVCTSDADCGDLELCMLDSAATKSVGHTIMVCVIGCDAELETVEVQNEDGTSSQATSKVPGTDTCQRFGDETLYCDLTSHECQEYSAEEPVVEPEPVDPEPVEPTVTMNEVKWCYDEGDLVGKYGIFSFSVSTGVNPSGWTQVPDLSIGADGCVVGLAVNATAGFWVDLTTSLYPKTSDDLPDEFWSNFWVAEKMKPSAAFVDGVPVLIGDFANGWEIGDVAK